MDQATLALVWQRVNASCEYCQLPQSLSSIPFEIDHIIAQKHGGATELANLALSCFYCNSYKGPNIAGLDPESKRIIRLYHPRKDTWTKISMVPCAQQPNIVLKLSVASLPQLTAAFGGTADSPCSRNEGVMSEMLKRKCPDCDSAMCRIKLIDKTHGGAHADLEYTVPEAKKSFWFGQFPVEGQVVAYMCDQCGRILLYGAASAES